MHRRGSKWRSAPGALDDPLAEAAKERVDAARLGYLRTLLLENGYTDADARQTAQILYLLVLGAGDMLPPVPPDELRELARWVCHERA
ncbi:hypothetical protein OHB12_30510 [Nocardia sp. NBC_01730]|uniref:hypothetical protein n=1 Tax=Nocardia sp. NBC_01730 TaxID=2975998 RepID=UPI002E13A851|nr:hypothetical protein OHB12_30510 [Nocardia sp. NBC_01730]